MMKKEQFSVDQIKNTLHKLGIQYCVKVKNQEKSKSK